MLNYKTSFLFVPKKSHQVTQKKEQSTPSVVEKCFRNKRDFDLESNCVKFH